MQNIDGIGEIAENRLPEEGTAACTEQPVPAYKPRKKRFGDRNDGRKLRTLEPLHRVMCYIMPKRSDAQVTFYDRLDIERAEALCRHKVQEGMKNFTVLHVILAAYLRTITERPGINRFISGQKVYARNEIVFNMAVKQEMSLLAPETMIKVKFDPADTMDEVYRKFDAAVREAISPREPTAFDKVAGILNKVPGFVLRWTVGLLNAIDYHGLLPGSLLDVSPFHGSMIITSMGSLGINPIYHHIYDFGNLPVFLSYGTKKTVYEYDHAGKLQRHRFIELKAVCDERVCNGYYFASAFKIFKKYVEHPDALNEPPRTVTEDID